MYRFRALYTHRAAAFSDPEDTLFHPTRVYPRQS